MKTISLNHGFLAIVDDSMFSWLSLHKWRIGSKGYAVRWSSRKNPPRKMLYMHVEIARKAGIAITRTVDHKNLDTLDNRVSNLRAATSSNQQMNKLKIAATSSEYKGVYWNARHGRWTARIKKDGKTVHLGDFTFEVNAARAYDIAARKYFGKFARTNFGGR